MQSVHDGLCLRRAITFQQIAFRLLIVSRRSSSKVEIGHHHIWGEFVSVKAFSVMRWPTLVDAVL